MPVTMMTVRIKVDEGSIADVLRDALQKMDGARGELLLNLSSVRRLDAGAVREMEKFVTLADERDIKVTLRGVNIDVYKVLKLVDLTPRFSFLTETGESAARPS